MGQCCCLSPSLPLLLLQCPQVCSLCLRLYSCPESRFISTFFLDSIQPNVFHELLRARFGLTTSSFCKISLHKHHNTFIQKTKENSDKAPSCCWLDGGNAASIETLFNPSFLWLWVEQSFSSVWNHLILCCPLLLLPSIVSSIRVFSNKSALHIRCPEYWSFSISPSNEYSALISFKIDWFIFITNGKNQENNILWYKRILRNSNFSLRN